MTRPYTVLVLEDDAPLRGVLVDLLGRWGWTVHATGIGDEAIRMVRRHPIDFSILDMHLPGTHGCDVLRTIREQIRPLPTIMMSGEASRAEAELAMRIGAFQLLRKPLDGRVLRETCDRLLAQHFPRPPHGAGPTPS